MPEKVSDCQPPRLCESEIHELRDEGNSVMVVEHDAETMMSADWLVDVGPGAGENGGQICLSAPLQALNGGKQDEWYDPSRIVIKPSITLDYLQGRKQIATPSPKRVFFDVPGVLKF